MSERGGKRYNWYDITDISTLRGKFREAGRRKMESYTRALVFRIDIKTWKEMFIMMKMIRNICRNMKQEGKCIA